MLLNTHVRNRTDISQKFVLLSAALGNLMIFVGRF